MELLRGMQCYAAVQEDIVMVAAVYGPFLQREALFSEGSIMHVA